MDLPEKIFEVINIPITDDIISVAQYIIETGTTGIGTLERLRELSDGFLYGENKSITIHNSVARFAITSDTVSPVHNLIQCKSGPCQITQLDDVGLQGELS